MALASHYRARLKRFFAKMDVRGWINKFVPRCPRTGQVLEVLRIFRCFFRTGKISWRKKTAIEPKRVEQS